jgi:hypothetical protein
MLGPDRFTREIRVAAALNHPHILPFHDSGEAGGRLFYVMPYVRGGSLRQRLAAEPQLPVDEAVRWSGRWLPPGAPTRRPDPSRDEAGEHPIQRGGAMATDSTPLARTPTRGAHSDRALWWHCTCQRALRWLASGRSA